MKIIFISNALNHHQLPVALEFNKGNEFYFVSTIPTPTDKLQLGYADLNEQYDFVVKYYTPEGKEKTQRLINEADVVIASSCTFPFAILVERLKKNKLTFWFSERLFKVSPLMCFYPPTVKRVLSQCTKYRKNNFYLLSVGGFVTRDYAFFNAFKGKAFKWGYFPAVKTGNLQNLQSLKEQNSCLNIVWTGRFIGWKHPELAIKAAEFLKRKGLSFHMNLIGQGELFSEISNEIKKKNLQKNISLLGAMPYRKVSDYMDQADIFLFTSDRREGWGAVLNESMNSACAIVCNENIGGGSIY